MQSVYDFLDLWLKHLVVSKTAACLSNPRVQKIKLLSSRLLTKGEETDYKLLQSLFLQGGRLSVSQRVSQTYCKLESSLDDVITYFFSTMLSPVDKRLLTCELEQIFEERYRSLGKSLNLGYFFSNVEKMRYFATSCDFQTAIKLLVDLQLGLTGKKNQSGDVDHSIQDCILRSGIELFK